MHALITGAGGFVGTHLLTYLRTLPDVTLTGTLFSDAERRPDLAGLCPDLRIVDLRDEQAVYDLLAELHPDEIYHLAGQSYVPRSFEFPWETLENNIRSTLNLLEAMRKLNLHTRILVIGSAEAYGGARPDQLPLTENSPFAPNSPYSVSKIAQDMLALQYHRAYQLFTVRVRPFNHIGPGQDARFALADWAAQIAEAELGKREPVVYVGNLSAARDFTDVRDVVHAYKLLLTHGEAGEVYQVCSGKAHTMQTLLDTLISASRVPIEIRVDPARYRPVEIPVLLGDYSRLRNCTGWQPQITIEQTLRDILDDFRQKRSAQPANRP